MTSFFKKKGVGGGGGGSSGSSAIHVTDSEAALAQSDFNTDKILEIQNKFTRGSSLLHPGRIFIREGALWKVCRKGTKKRQFFLFNDILVYGSVVANRYSNQHILPLSQMSVTSECFYQPRADTDFDEEFEQLELDVANAFQICHADKSFHVFAQSSADKNNWVNNLQKHISRVAQSLSGDQQLLTKPVWVPDSSCKECMICNTKFTPFIRKHHCRQCGRVICSSCSPYRVAFDVSVDGSSDSKKMERICKDCFKDRSAHVVRRTSGSKAAPSRPPPPNVAAKAVSEVIQSTVPSTNYTTPANMSSSNLSPQLTGHDNNTHHDNSTDTEDSDDSDNEDNMEERELISNKEAAASKTEEESQKNEPEPPVIQDSESQPTPPPRKKRLKKKLEEVLTKEMESVIIGGRKQVTPPPSDVAPYTSDKAPPPSDVAPPPSNDGVAEEADQTTVQEQPQNTTETSPKKARRRKKHAGLTEPDSQHNEVSNNMADIATSVSMPSSCASQEGEDVPSQTHPLPSENSQPLIHSDIGSPGEEEILQDGARDITHTQSSGDEDDRVACDDGPDIVSQVGEEPNEPANADTAGAEERKKRGRRNKFK